MVNTSGRNNGNYRHGGHIEHKPEHNSWRAMVARCYNENYVRFDRYGGRGITVCDTWLGKDGFKNFLRDMGKKPSPKYSIDRIDNNGNYEPENCRWITQREQILNSSTVKILEVDGVTCSIGEHIKRYGISTTLYYKRMKELGMTSEEALTTPNTGKADALERRRIKYMNKRKRCFLCGNLCRLHKNFCSVECSNKGRNALKSK